MFLRIEDGEQLDTSKGNLTPFKVVSDKGGSVSRPAVEGNLHVSPMRANQGESMRQSLWARQQAATLQ